MAKKKGDDKKKELNFDGLIGGKIPTPIVEGVTDQKAKDTKNKKKGKTGPPLQNPKDWVKVMIKLDPTLKKKIKALANNDESLTISLVINNALKQYLKK